MTINLFEDLRRPAFKKDFSQAGSHRFRLSLWPFQVVPDQLLSIRSSDQAIQAQEASFRAPVSSDRDLAPPFELLEKRPLR